MNNKKLNARNLRKNQTPQEQTMWKLLKNRQLCNYKFRRQYVIGKYVVDFVCRERKLIIEIDGGQHNEQENIEYDKARTEFLEQEGYRVIRFWNNDVDKNLEGVYKTILGNLE